MAVIGIDLGTTYSAAARCVNGVAEIIDLDGRPTLPSVVGLQRNGRIAIGWTAKRNQANAPTNTIIEVKRQMGDPSAKVKLGDLEKRPQEISALVLARIKELAEAQLGEPVTGAVISCPAYFKDPARAATKEAAELAGLKVLRIINEPTAAAYAYGVREGNDATEKLFVIYDLGGGTFDVTVIKMVAGLLDVIGTGGDPQLGGGNFDDRIVDWMIEQISTENPEYAASLTSDKRTALRMRLKLYAEEGKIALCSNPAENAEHTFNIATVDIFQNRPILFNKKLTRAQFDELIDNLLENSLKWIDEALKIPKETHNYTEQHLTAILLVGGSTRVPLVRRKLEKRFPSTPVWGQERGINPDEIVAMGASLVAADVDASGESVGPGSVLVDVTGHTLSVAAIDERKGREMLSPIIAKETQIPCEGEHEFSSMGRGQRQVTIRVYQGEGLEVDLEKVTMIGNFNIEIDPIEAPTPLKIGLKLDESGILTAYAANMLSNQRVTCRIEYSDSAKIPPEELARKRAELQAQLNAVIGQLANPLGDAAAAGQTARPPAQAGSLPPAMATAAMAPVDPTTMMNPIMRMLYQKAIGSYMRMPPDRQAALMQIVTEVEQAARAGDVKVLEGFAPQLSKILEGID